MNISKVYSALCIVQGLYTLLTALWALVDIGSFMAVTGYKTDVWLVKTVSAILVAIGFCFLSGPFVKRDFFTIIIVGISSCAALAAVDFYYTANNTIKKIYRADGFLQVLFLITWLYLSINTKKLQQHSE
jgi:hypothetical protein